MEDIVTTMQAFSQVTASQVFHSLEDFKIHVQVFRFDAKNVTTLLNLERHAIS